MELPEQVTIKEVGPRDGLQNEKEEIPTDQKVAWIEKLANTGLSYIEITSFVHPKWIPQLKDAVEVAKRVNKKENMTIAALVPNMKGLERALEADIDEVSIFMSVSETHNKKNINKSIEETYPILNEVVREAKLANKSVRGYISTAFGCPYEGQVEEQQLVKVCNNLFEMDIDELSIGDTIGVANPLQVSSVLKKLERYFPKDQLALHFHDTRGLALANTLAALQLGFHTFDSAAGGLGGCPYAKGASGNVATDDLNYMLQSLGIHTGVDQAKLLEATSYIQEMIDRPLPSKQMQILSRS